MTRTVIFGATSLVAMVLFGGSASAATYFVTETGTDAGDCTVTPCETVQYAIEQHRLAPQPNDVIDVGDGDFTGNFEADQPEDDNLTIRGTLSGSTRQTTLHGEGDGDGAGLPAAFVVGACDTAQANLRNINVDTEFADADVGALALDGGSDLHYVNASNRAGSDALAVAFICQRGTNITRSQITATGDEVGVAMFENAKIYDSTITAEDFPAVNQFSVFPPSSRELTIMRSRVSVNETGAFPPPAIESTSPLLLDSSLVTGGSVGVEMAWEGARWRINNSTIDAGEAGVVEPVDDNPSIGLAPFGAPADVDVTNSLLVEGIAADDSFGGTGDVLCDFSDLPDTDLPAGFTDSCPIGGASTNTTNPPGDLFVGGAPYSWSLNDTSPAIDTATPGPVPPRTSDKDLIGKPRRTAGSTAACPLGTIDKGAYEFVGPPCNLTLPTIPNGANPHPGEQLTSTAGSWSNSPTSIERKWLRCDASGNNCADATGYRTRKGFRVRRTDIGSTFAVTVKASNAAGEGDPVTSAVTGVVTP